MASDKQKAQRAAADAKLVAKIKANGVLTPDEKAWARQHWGREWQAKEATLRPKPATQAPTTPAAPPARATPMPVDALPPPPPANTVKPPVVLKPGMPGYTPPAQPGAPGLKTPINPAPAAPATLRGAADKVSRGELLTPAEEALLRKEWPGQMYWDKIKQHSPAGSPNLPTIGVNPPPKGGAGTGAPGTKAPPTTPTPPTPPTPPTTPALPGTGVPTVTPSTPIPVAPANPVPTAPNTPGLDGGEYPKWMTDLLADPKKLADPKNAAAITNYLATIGDKRSEAQWREENAWRQGQDTFNMKLTDRQQVMAEWQAKNTQTNVENQLKLDTTQVTGNLANNATEIANNFAIGTGKNTNDATANENTRGYQTGLLSNSATEIANNKAIADAKQKLEDARLLQDAALNRENQANQLTQSRYSAFGRAKAPNTRSLRSWG